MQGSLTSVANGAAFNVPAKTTFSLQISGSFVATLRVEKQCDGETWTPMGDAIGSPIEIQGPVNVMIESPFSCPHRIACTEYTSGTANWSVRE